LPTGLAQNHLRNAEPVGFSVPTRVVHMQGAMESIMLLLVVAALIGELITLAVLWPYGALVAFIGAPFGASALTLDTRRVKQRCQIHTAP
jgi:hypothetical protein